MGQKEIKLKQGEPLFHEGDLTKNLYLVKKGSIRIYKQKSDSDIEIDTIRAGQIIGELSFFDHNPRSASAEALTDCDVVEISADVFNDALSKMPDWIHLLIKTITGRIRSANNKIRLLESATTDYEVDKYGNRSREFFFITNSELLRFCTALLAVAARYGKNNTTEGIEFPQELLERFAVISLIELFKKIEILKDGLFLTDIKFIDQIILFINEQNLAEPSKKRILTPRGFIILSLVMQNLSKSVKAADHFMKVNIAPSLKAAGIQQLFLQELQEQGFLNDILLTDANCIEVQYDLKKIIFEYRAFWLIQELDKLNEQKRKA